MPRPRYMWFDKFLLCFRSISAGPLRGQCARADRSGDACQLPPLHRPQQRHQWLLLLPSGCLFALGKAVYRTQLLSPAAAGCSGSVGVRDAPALCSAETSRNPWQNPAQRPWPLPGLSPPKRCVRKSPVLSQTSPSNFPTRPRPPPFAQGLHLGYIPTCMAPPSPLGVFLPPSPLGLSLWNCAMKHIVSAEPRDLSLALGLSFVSAFKERGKPLLR